MTGFKPIFADSLHTRSADAESEECRVALEYLAEAWNTAEDEGVESLALAHASLFAALATLVKRHGEAATADLVAALPDRIASGEYTLDRNLQ